MRRKLAVLLLIVSLPALGTTRFSTLPVEPVSFDSIPGDKVSFLAHVPGAAVYVGPGGACFRSASGARFGFDFAGADASSPGVLHDRLVTLANYYPDHDPHHARLAVPRYAGVTFASLYPGIDLTYHGRAGQLEFDFAVSPGASANAILLRPTAGSLNAENGDVVLRADDGELRLHAPSAYQIVGGVRRQVKADWLITPTGARIRVGRYDRRRSLIIDPVVSYVTLFDAPIDLGSDIMVDSADNLYFATSRADQTTALVRKFAPDGTLLSETEVAGASLRRAALDAAGNVYLVGYSMGGLPLVNSLPGGFKGPPCPAFGFDKMLGCGDAFVLKLDSSGKIAFSTYLGGSVGEMATGVAVDAAGAIYVVGNTASPDFPVVHAAQPKASSTVGIGPCGSLPEKTVVCQMDSFVAKVDPKTPELLYSTYLGGTDLEWGAAVAVDASGNAWVTGTTQSADFPLVKAAHNTGLGFIAKFDPSGQLLLSSYLGTTFQGWDVAVDASNNAIFAGYEYPGWNSFVRKLDPTGAELSTWLIASNVATNVSGNPTLAGRLALDRTGNIYVGGYTRAVDLPVINPLQGQLAGDYDAFLTEFSPSGDILNSTYLGGSDFDLAASIAVDSSNAVYVAGWTYSSDFPLLDNAVPSTTGQGNHFLLKIIEGNSSGLTLNPGHLDFGAQTTGVTSAPRTVVATNNGLTPIALTGVTLDDPLNSSAFHLANGCGANLLAGASCSVAVTVKPAYYGSYVATITFTGSFGRVRLGVSAEGVTDGAPALRLMPQTRIGYAIPGTIVPLGVVRVSNFGTTPLTVQSISVPDGFGYTSDCPPSIAKLSTCLVSLVFKPTATGTFFDHLTIATNDPGSPQSWIELEGHGEDFNIAPAQSTASVTAGGSASYSLTLTSQLNNHSAIVGLACSGLPAQSICAFSASQVLIGSGSTATQVTIATTASRVAKSRRGRPVWLALWLPLLGLLLLDRSRRRAGTLFVLALLVLLSFVGCGGGGASVSQQPIVIPGTPAGTYTIQVSGTAGTLQRATNLTLTVQ